MKLNLTKLKFTAVSFLIEIGAIFCSVDCKFGLEIVKFAISFLIILLFLNVYVFYGDLALEGSNQFILLTGAFLAILVGFKNKVNIFYL